MGWSFSIGRLFGSEIRIHLTFFLLLIWIGTSAFTDGGWPAAIENVAFILVLFGCVVAHEFGHALMARRYGIATPDITLLPIGGLARLEKMPEDPRQEIAVALAGPAVNIVIWGVLTGLLGVPSSVGQLTAIEVASDGFQLSEFLGRVALVNLFLAVFNMLPAFPMDGGRVLRATLSLFMDRVRATRTAAKAGQSVAFLLALLGLTSGNIMLILVAFFVFVAAGYESQDVEVHAMARKLLARDAMITHFETLGPSDSLAAAGDALIRTTQHEFPVVDAAGALVGFLTRQALFTAYSDTEKQKSVEEMMTRDIPETSLMQPLDQVFDLMHEGTVPAVAVTGSHGQFIGYITRENIGEMMVIAGRSSTK